MVSTSEVVERKGEHEYEINFPEACILRHIRHLIPTEQKTTRLRVVDTSHRPMPTWSHDSFYLANIGGAEKPLFLELRFEEASEGLWIALLMTNERTPRDLELMSRRLTKKIYQRGIGFEAVIGVEALGSKLSQEMARLLGQDALQTTFQKGKPRVQDRGLVIGPPKEWVDPADFVLVRSGTSGKAPQAIFMDRKIAKVFGDTPTVIVDDARLTSGTIDGSIKLARKMGINIVCTATVLNEAEPTEEIMGAPYVSLVKIPVFSKDDQGFHPIEGSFERVESFYIEF